MHRCGEMARSGYPRRHVGQHRVTETSGMRSPCSRRSISHSPIYVASSGFNWHFQKPKKLATHHEHPVQPHPSHSMQWRRRGSKPFSMFRSRVEFVARGQCCPCESRRATRGCCFSSGGRAAHRQHSAFRRAPLVGQRHALLHGQLGEFAISREAECLG